MTDFDEQELRAERDAAIAEVQAVISEIETSRRAP